MTQSPFAPPAGPSPGPAAYPGAPTLPPRDRARLRRRLFLAGLVPLLVVLLVGLKVGLMLGHDRDGRAAFADGDYPGARSSFADNAGLNVLETWVAPFDEGTALLADEEYDAALGRLEAALDHVPDEERCTVLVNVALAHEGLGDAAVSQDQDLATATEQWEAGRAALASADCPTDAGRGEEQSATATAVDDRLAGKLDADDEEEQPQDQPDQEQPPPPSPEQAEKEKKLEKRNQQGQEDRRDQQEYEEYEPGSPDGPAW